MNSRTRKTFLISLIRMHKKCEKQCEQVEVFQALNIGMTNSKAGCDCHIL